jgi:hypothetical protein
VPHEGGGCQRSKGNKEEGNSFITKEEGNKEERNSNLKGEAQTPEEGP